MMCVKPPHVQSVARKRLCALLEDEGRETSAANTNTMEHTPSSGHFLFLFLVLGLVLVLVLSRDSHSLGLCVCIQLVTRICSGGL